MAEAPERASDKVFYSGYNIIAESRNERSCACPTEQKLQAIRRSPRYRRVFNEHKRSCEGLRYGRRCLARRYSRRHRGRENVAGLLKSFIGALPGPRAVEQDVVAEGVVVRLVVTAHLAGRPSGIRPAEAHCVERRDITLPRWQNQRRVGRRRHRGDYEPARCIRTAVESMSETLAGLLEKNSLEVFGERNPALRMSAIESIYTDDCTFFEGDEEITGRAALSAKVDAILQGLPADFSFRAVAPAAVNHNVGRLAWRLGPDAGPPAATGLDVALFKNGRIHSLYVFRQSRIRSHETADRAPHGDDGRREHGCLTI